MEVVGQILIKAAACRTKWPYIDEPSLVINCNVQAIICMILIRDSTNPFWVWTCGIECSTLILNESSKLFDINSPALSILMLLVEYSRKYAQPLLSAQVNV